MIDRDVHLLKELGWEAFVQSRRGVGDLTEMTGLRHPARRLLRQYRFAGVPVKLTEGSWGGDKIREALQRGPHPSALLHSNFLMKEFISMIGLDQWVILPYSVAKYLDNLHISPPGVIPQRDRRPRWICDYTWSGVGPSSLPLVPTEAMQYGRAFERILRQILLADPRFGPVYLSKCDIADGYYRLGLNVKDIPKLAVAFPSPNKTNPLVAIPLVLPMGWKNSGVAFCAASETIADVSNAAIASNKPQLQHHLDARAAAMDYNSIPNPSLSKHYQLSPGHPQRNPLLKRPSPKRLAAIDVFVDDFIALAQGCPKQLSRVR